MLQGGDIGIGAIAIADPIETLEFGTIEQASISQYFQVFSSVFKRFIPMLKRFTTDISVSPLCPRLTVCG
jgi:hypothetical protein